MTVLYTDVEHGNQKPWKLIWDCVVLFHFTFKVPLSWISILQESHAFRQFINTTSRKYTRLQNTVKSSQEKQSHSSAKRFLINSVNSPRGTSRFSRSIHGVQRNQKMIYPNLCRLKESPVSHPWDRVSSFLHLKCINDVRYGRSLCKRALEIKRE